MNKSTIIKFVQFGLILVLGIAADQWTKWYSEQRLAMSRPGVFQQEVVLKVPEADAGKTVRDYIAQEFTWSTADEIDHLSKRYLRAEDDRRIYGEDKVEAGQIIRVTYRHVTVIPDYFDLQYTRNPGAAFGFMSNSDSPFRRPFFVGVSALAIILIIYILAGIALEQQLLIWGLSLIASGAVGNFIDRVRFGYVIDFIVWKYTDQYRWPTFNIADALICIGVGFMFIEILRDALKQRRDAQQSAPLVEASDEESATTA
jgi:signal peptidase II